MLKRALQFFFQRDLFESAQARAEARISQSGKAWPCQVVSVEGALVTVSFEINTPFPLPTIQMPKAESPWIRMPTQKGDYGITLPADVYIGAITGMGDGVATLARPFNLSELIFVPVSNQSSPPPNQTQAIVQGPGGALLQTADGSASVNIGPNGIVLTFGDKVVELNSKGFTIDGILFDTHAHIYTPGSGTPTDTGGPVS
jgi:hypothetical protein